MSDLNLYSVITELVEVGSDNYHTDGYYYRTELREYELNLLEKEDDQYTVEDLDGEEFSGSLDELCEMASVRELIPNELDVKKDGFVINGEIMSEYDDHNEENHSKWYGEYFYKSLEDAENEFKKNSNFWVENF
tara:strand:- start:46 stop:447 length:402 start_codon:yes stop_codon:yes gene_type:complete